MVIRRAVITQEWAAAHAAFHAALVDTRDSPWLLRIRDMLYAQSERYRWFSVPSSEENEILKRNIGALLTL